MILSAIILGALAANLPHPALAQEAAPLPFVDEIRGGVYAHDLESTANENGADFNIEILLHRYQVNTGSRLVDYFLSPRPHIGAALSLAGDTSKLYFGVTWDKWLNDLFFFETSFGGALHNGPTGDYERPSFGCSLNFHETASLGMAMSDHWRLLATVDHMSNAGLCDQNRGLTSGGVRLGYQW